MTSLVGDFLQRTDIHEHAVAELLLRDSPQWRQVGAGGELDYVLVAGAKLLHSCRGQPQLIRGESKAGNVSKIRAVL